MTPREQGVIEGWMMAITHLEEYGGVVGRVLAGDMRTRFPEPRVDLYVVTEGDYEDETPVGVFDSLKMAMGQYDVTVEWMHQASDVGIWMTRGSVPCKNHPPGWHGHAAIYRVKLNETWEDE